METLKLNNEMITRINNDVNGNPRYYISIMEFIDLAPEDIFFLDKCNFIYRKMQGTGFKKYRGKQFGGGFVFQSYNTQASLDRLTEQLTKNN